MKRIIICGLICLSLALTSCTEDKPKLTLNLDNKKGEIEQKSAIFHVNQDNINLTIANYELDPKHTYGASENRVRAEGQYKLNILMFDLEGDKKTHLEPSVYARNEKESTKESKALVSTLLYYYGDGSEKVETLPDENEFPAKVNLTEFTADSVSGEIDIRDAGGKLVKGSFTAKLVKE